MDLTPPPGVWLAPRGASQGPAGTNEQVITSPAIVPMGDPPYWKSWKEVPMDPMEVAKFGRWFVEIFSGAARLTQSARNKMIPCLPPIDITLCTEIPVPFDVLDADQWQRFMQLIYFGLIFFAHFGTPCNSYSAARKDDGGPPPLRSIDFPDGLPSLSDQNMCIVFLGNLFNDRTCEACAAIVDMGGDFSIENPLGSLLWETPSMRALILNARACSISQAYSHGDLQPTFAMLPAPDLSGKPCSHGSQRQSVQRTVPESCLSHKVGTGVSLGSLRLHGS